MSDNRFNDERLKKYLQDHAPTPVAPEDGLEDKILDAAKSQGAKPDLVQSFFSNKNFLIGLGSLLAIVTSVTLGIWVGQRRNAALVPLEKFAEETWDGALGEDLEEEPNIIVDLEE